MGKKRAVKRTELPPEAQALVAAYEEAKAAREAWNERAEKLRQEVINALGQADVGEVGGREVVKYTRVSSTRVDAPTLKATYPEVYDQVTKTSVAYRLTTSLHRETPDTAW